MEREAEGREEGGETEAGKEEGKEEEEESRQEKERIEKEQTPERGKEQMKNTERDHSKQHICTLWDQSLNGPLS